VPPFDGLKFVLLDLFVLKFSGIAAKSLKE